MGKKAVGSRNKKTRIMIVDDHPLVRQGLRTLIEGEADLQVSAEAEDATGALQAVEQDAPDLAIIDISLSDGNGLELIKQIKAVNSEVRMLVSSMHDESLYAERSLHAGAMGYVNKHEPPETLIEAIRQVMKGKVWLSERMSERVFQRVLKGDSAMEKSPVDNLSDRQLEVFELIGQGLNTREIAEKLHLSPKTVETHQDNIKEKLNLASNLELVRYATQWTLEQT